jgi:hypothetical protein
MYGINLMCIWFLKRMGLLLCHQIEKRKESRGFRVDYKSIIIYRGVEQLVARWAHNPKVTGSSPVPATSNSDRFDRYFFLYPLRFKIDSLGLIRQLTIIPLAFLVTFKS